MKIRSHCPRCNLNKSKKNGHAKNGKQTNRCKTEKKSIVFTRTRIEIDEMWSFVKKKKNAIWI